MEFHQQSMLTVVALAAKTSADAWGVGAQMFLCIPGYLNKVEQPAVHRKDIGSNPISGAKLAAPLRGGKTQVAKVRD